MLNLASTNMRKEQLACSPKENIWSLGGEHAAVQVIFTSHVVPKIRDFIVSYQNKYLTGVFSFVIYDIL